MVLFGVIYGYLVDPWSSSPLWGTESPRSPGNGMWHATQLVRTNGGEVVHLSGAKVGLLVHIAPLGVPKTWKIYTLGLWKFHVAIENRLFC